MECWTRTFTVKPILAGLSDFDVIGWFIIMMLLGMLLVYAAIPAILAYIVLNRIPPQFRKQKPALAFLMLIPLFTHVWTFFVHPRVAKSIKAYLDDQGPQSSGDCGDSIALWSCICFACSIIPFLNIPAFFTASVLLILFYVKAFKLTAGLSAKGPAVGAGQEMRHEEAIPSAGIPPIIVVVRRKWSVAAYVIAAILGLGVLAWPLFSFMVIFAFDAPIKNPADEIQRYTIAFSTWFYPAFYASGFFLYHLSRKWRIGEMLSLTTWLQPALVPAYYVWFFFNSPH